MDIAGVAVSNQMEARGECNNAVAIDSGVGGRGQGADADQRQSVKAREARVARSVLNKENRPYCRTLADAC